MAVGQALEEPGRVVGEIADGPARERRQARDLRRRAAQRLAQRGQEIAGHAARPLRPAHAHAGGVRFDRGHRIAARNE